MTFKALLTFLLSSAFFLAPGAASASVLDPLIDSNGGVPSSGVPAVSRPAPLSVSSRTFTAYFISVGQGDAEYLELPNGRNVLIDGGPADPAGTGDPLIAQFLTQHNITKLDYVVLTHPHADHYVGLLYAADRVKIDNFYDTQLDNMSATGDNKLREKLRASGTRFFYPSAGDTLDWDPGEVQVKVLNGCPAAAQTTIGQVMNDCSIVLKVTFQRVSILYTGDIQDDVEAGLAQKFGGELKSDILKVGHHGSPHSSSTPFLDMVKPSVAFIEVGVNDYGHPAPSAVSRLQQAGAEIHRTDKEGTLKFTINSFSIEPLIAGDPSAAVSSRLQ